MKEINPNTPSSSDWHPALMLWRIGLGQFSVLQSVLQAVTYPGGFLTQQANQAGVSHRRSLERRHDESMDALIEDSADLLSNWGKLFLDAPFALWRSSTSLMAGNPAVSAMDVQQSLGRAVEQSLRPWGLQLDHCVPPGVSSPGQNQAGQSWFFARSAEPPLQGGTDDQSAMMRVSDTVTSAMVSG